MAENPTDIADQRRCGALGQGQRHPRPGPPHPPTGTPALRCPHIGAGQRYIRWIFGDYYRDHYWNRLPDGSEVDLTADQFRPDEEVVGGRVVARPPDAPRRHREQYELLRERVLEALAADARS
ncbi:YunG family protein [Streptosporangium canum]|uniref:YunG family protein n=1 Tax=Streptosporangium canum TaxID=324952 RepID=UPI003F4E1CAA